MGDSGKFRVLLKNVHVNTKVNEIKKFFRPLRIKDAKILKRGVAVVYFKTAEDLNNSFLKEGELHGSIVKVEKYENDLFVKASDAAESKRTWEVIPKGVIINDIKENGRLFVRNLSYDCTENDLIALFSPFGTISEIHLSYDPRLNRSRGFAFVSFLFPSDAASAFEKLDKQKFQDRLIHILPGKDRPIESGTKSGKQTVLDSDADADTKDDQSTILSEFQRKRISDLKAVASVSHNWNTLFISADAVATYLAAKFGVTKEELHDSTGKESAAVRLAHGEAQLVSELRQFLVNEGVRIDLLESGQGRRDRSEAQGASTHRQLSGTAFILKNLPVGTKENEVRDLISRLTKSGGLRTNAPKRVIVPPLGITAIVEYEVPQFAKIAYKSLSYEPYNDNVLFVQWAPDGILSPKLPNASEEVSKLQMKESKMSKFEDMSSLIATEDISQTELESTTVFESSSSVEKKKKRRKVENIEEIEAVDIDTEPASKVKQEHSSTQNLMSGDVNRSLLVRNVAFQASEGELMSLFKPIRGLVKVRMPKKPTGGHRGFAFVEFTTEQQAKSALETFGVDTHFYGRRLNIEFAKSS